MAHTCPECDCYCTCSGDWDDADLGYEPPGGCKHYLSDGCDYNSKDDDEYDNSDDEDDYEPPPRITDDPNQLDIFKETNTPPEKVKSNDTKSRNCLRVIKGGSY